MEIEKQDNNTFLLKLELNYLEKNTITKTDFMKETQKSKLLINQIKQQIKNKYGLITNLKEQNTYLIKNTFYIYLTSEKHQYEFETKQDLTDFFTFISTTKYKNQITLNKTTNQIHLNKNITPVIFTHLKEFTK